MDWAAWSEAPTSLSPVAEDEVIRAANDLAKAMAAVGAQAHRRDQDGERRHPQIRLADARSAFVDAARRSLDRERPPARARRGGRFAAEPTDPSHS
ncbi:hypothetical protein GCM10010433_58050 [Streptomyces pulveraceus]